MIRHKAIRPNHHVGVARLLRQQLAIDFVVAIPEKYRFSPVSSLRDVVRHTRNDDAR